SALNAPLSALSNLSLDDLLNYTELMVDPRPRNPLGPILRDALDRKWSAVGQKILYFLAKTALATAKWEAWDRGEIATASISGVTIKDTRITGNRAHDDGGGLYASVFSRMSLSSVEVSGNSSDSMGGGIRLTMGSHTVIKDCKLTGNNSGRGGVGPDGHLRR